MGFSDRTDTILNRTELVHTRYILTLDIQETISFAQHLGGSDCGCPQ